MLYGLRNRRGETLIETLVSLAIAAISMLMFASMLAHTRHTAKIGQGWNAYINDRSVYLEKKPGENETEEMKEVGVTSSGGKITIAKGENKLIDSDVTFYVAHYGEEDDEKNVVVSYGSTS